MKLTWETIAELKQVLPGNAAIYRIRGGILEPLYTAPTLPALHGMTLQDYEEQIRNKAEALVLEEDRKELRLAVSRCGQTGAPLDLFCRALHRKKGFVWMHISAKRCGELEGSSVLLASYSNAFGEEDIYQNLLDHSETAVYVCDRHTNEVLYLNEAARVRSGDQENKLLGKQCYQYIRGQYMRCQFCLADLLKAGVTKPTLSYDAPRAVWESVSGSFLNWCGHEAFAHFIRDVTQSETLRQELEKSRDELVIQHDQAIQSLLTANPEALCTFQLNLSENLCDKGHGVSKKILDALQSDTVDGLFANVVRRITDSGQRERFCEVFCREALLAAWDAGDSSFHMDYQREDEEGKRFWVRIYLNLLQNPQSGDVEGVIYSVDYSKEKRQAAVFHTMTNRHFDLLALIHLDTAKFETLNLSAKLPDIYQSVFPPPGESLPFAELIDKAAESLLLPEDIGSFRSLCQLEHIARKLNGCGYFEYIFTERAEEEPDGRRYRKIQHHFLGEERDTVLLVQSDITEEYRRQKQELARAQEEAERIREILDSINGGIGLLFMPNPDHVQLQYANRYLYRLLRINAPEAMKSTEDAYAEGQLEDALSSIHPKDRARVQAVFRDHFTAEQFVVHNYRARTGDGSYIWLQQEVRLREITPQGRSFYATYRNINEEVRLQEEVQKRLEREISLRKQAMAASTAKSDFLSRMSHDLRTPLSAVIGLSHLALDENLKQQEVRQYLWDIHRSGEHLLGMINDVLDMSKIENNQMILRPSPYSFREFCDTLHSVIDIQCAQKGVLFEISPPAEEFDETILVDRTRFNQVFLNLLTNAVKFTPKGGRVRLELEHLSQEEGCLSLRFTVRDSGVGMSPEFILHAFEPFVQQREDDRQMGAGLGLAIVKKLVELMGGEIRIDSELGRGTAMIVDLNAPMAPQRSEVPKEALYDRSRLLGKRLLLCEDNRINAVIVETLLKNAGMTVEHAENGRVGLERFQESPQGYFDCILMDIRMPEMDGLQTTRKIRALERADAKNIPILALTANAFEEDRKRCFAAGMDDHLAKPIESERLYHALLKWIP